MTSLIVVTEDAGAYLSLGVIQISVANLIIIGVMMLLFVLALVVPFPSHDHADEEGKEQ